MSPKKPTEQPKRSGPAFALDVVKAYHEVGHAVAAIDANIKLYHIVMRLDPADEPALAGQSAGAAKIELRTFRLGDELTPELRVAITKEVYVLLAGSAVDALLKGGKDKRRQMKPAPEDIVNTLFGIYDDLEQVVDRLRALVPERGARAGWVKEAYVRVTWWLSKNWAVIETLAERLRTNGKITGDEVATTMGEMNCSTIYHPHTGEVLDLGVADFLSVSQPSR